MSRTQGSHGTGSSVADATTANRVKRALEWRVGPENAVTLDQLSHELGLGGRTIRAAVQDHNATEAWGFAVATDDAGFYVATRPDHLDASIGRKASQVAVMQQGIDRLRGWQQRLRAPVVVRQMSLFERVA